MGLLLTFSTAFSFQTVAVGEVHINLKENQMVEETHSIHYSVLSTVNTLPGNNTTSKLFSSIPARGDR